MLLLTRKIINQYLSAYKNDFNKCWQKKFSMSSIAFKEVCILNMEFDRSRLNNINDVTAAELPRTQAQSTFVFCIFHPATCRMTSLRRLLCSDDFAK